MFLLRLGTRTILRTQQRAQVFHDTPRTAHSRLQAEQLLVGTSSAEAYTGRAICWRVLAHRHRLSPRLGRWVRLVHPPAAVLRALPPQRVGLRRGAELVEALAQPVLEEQ